ncbi:MAG: UDP-N-acetylmuramoyl-L-alanyl-D-glutamate--2,6-diaminopimelate ligase [Sedimentisphaerales bacterium]|nr:UDP-N-acetylmuramoyl-L-alanyl-D-glutamate--2,6-diaminopimelate ligase [Sedimentisphaerales bacterium]
MTFDELLTLVSADASPPIRIDSRQVQPGDVFVAVKGATCDGHDFIDQAAANGAGYIVYENGLAGADGPARIIVPDSAQAVGFLAQAANGSPAVRLTNLAVTGTNGKTTVAFLVHACIRHAKKQCGLLGTVVYDTGSGVVPASLTTPDSLTIARMQRQMVDAGAEYMVIEASSHALSQQRLAGIDFAAAAFTNLSGDHLDYHKTEVSYLAAKTRLFESLAPEATAVLNAQAPQSQSIARQTKARVVWYAVDEPADLTAHIESMTVDGARFTLQYQGQTARVATPLLGKYNVANHLAAAGLCLAEGFDLETVAAGLSSLRAIPGRLEKVGGAAFSVIVDFAHTDDALKNVLETSKPLCKGRLIVVFGCGGDRDKTKRPRMARVAETLADAIVVTSDNPRTEDPDAIIADIVAGFERGPAISANALRHTKVVEPDRRRAIELAIHKARKDDIVLIAGKGHEDYQIIGTEKCHFSDREVALECLGESLSVKTIAQIVVARTAPGTDAPVARIGTDSRTTRAGDCFLAIVGESFDGHDHVASAFAKGAVCAVVSRDVEVAEAQRKPLLRVADTVRALGDLARAYRRMHPFKVVAITGSAGKTTTRQIVHHVLSRHFRTHQARKNFNNYVGLPLTLLEADPGDEIIVAELGANRLGEIAYLTRIAQPDVAVVTNVHPAHLAGFGSLEAIVREKTSIAEGLPAGGVLIVNGDSEALVAACRERGGQFRTFGRSGHADFRAEQVVCAGLSSTFTIDGVPVHLPLPGPGNVENALAAWAVCAQFGLSVRDFADALRTLPPIAMRAEHLHIGTLTVLNDCYNANPASMSNALAMLRNVHSGNRRLVFICGAMAELGDQTEALHAELGRAVAETGVDLLLTVGASARVTAQAAQAARRDLRAVCFDDTPSLCDKLEQFVAPRDIILVKGSRTARLETVVGRLQALFTPAVVGPPIEEIPASRLRRRPESVKDREQG